MDVDWDALSSSWDTVEGAEHYAQRAFALIKPRLDPEKPPVVLDFGCGTGLQTAKLLNVTQRIVAVDTSQGMIDQFRSKFPDIESHAADICDLVSAMRETFDVVVSSSVLIFVKKLQETYDALAACLKPNGRLFQFDWYNEDDVQEGFTLDYVQKHAEKAGLDVVESEVVDFENAALPGPVLFVVMRKC